MEDPRTHLFFEWILFGWRDGAFYDEISDDLPFHGRSRNILYIEFTQLDLLSPRLVEFCEVFAEGNVSHHLNSVGLEVRSEPSCSEKESVADLLYP